MHTVHHSDLQIFWRRTCKVLLLIFWVIGLMLGMVTAVGAGDISFLMMRGDPEFTVSIPGLLLIIAFPFLFTAFAVFLSQPAVLLTVVSLKAFSFGFALFSVTLAYRSAFWLLQLLLMFGDICSVPLLMWLWLRYADLPDKDPTADLLLGLVISLVFGIIDICMVSPFAAMLL